jgi:hypothetical protein
MSEELDRRVQFLRDVNVEARDHSQGGLLDHLLGTRQLLLTWGARPALCDAAILHSIYGTEGYKQATAPLSMRTRVQDLIGNEAESLVWLFCFMRRDTFSDNVGRRKDLAVEHRLTGERLLLAERQFDDLVNLTFANELEPYPRMSRSWRRGCRVYLQGFRHLAMPGARQAFDAAPSSLVGVLELIGNCGVGLKSPAAAIRSVRPN